MVTVYLNPSKSNPGFFAVVSEYGDPVVPGLVLNREQADSWLAPQGYFVAKQLYAPADVVMESVG